MKNTKLLLLAACCAAIMPACAQAPRLHTVKIESIEELQAYFTYDPARDVIVSGPDADIKAGNCLPLENIPVGTVVHNIELQPGKGGQIARAAGMSAQLMAKEGKFATLKMPSGEMRYVLVTCKATIGQVGNLEHEIIRVGKAGKTRHMGVRPTVRGSVMNPCDHPHGGGEGKSPVGRPGPVTPWGKPALGYKTRKHKKASDKMIINRIN